MAKKTHGLSIFKLKDGVESFDDALKDTNLSSIPLHIDGIESAQLFFKSIAPKPPRWTDLFSSYATSDFNTLKNSGASAVLLAKKEASMYALPFGYGHTLLNGHVYEENFGLRVVLNSANPDGIKSLDLENLEAAPMQQKTQASKASEVTEFGIDVQRDILRSVTGISTNDALGANISGKDAFRINIPFELADLPSVLTAVEKAYISENYKTNFSWVDHLVEVRDASCVTALDSLLLDKLDKNELSSTWLAIPEAIDWQKVDSFAFNKPKRGRRHDDISWDAYIIDCDGEQLSADKLKKDSVFCIDAVNDGILHKWSVYKCAYCEIEHEGHTYALTNGKWYKIDRNFLASINSYINSIEASLIDLPPAIDQNEDDYNAAVASANPEQFALMDKEMIFHGGGYSKIEFCDLFSIERRIVHVKKYAASSVLSHLFSQGVVSARLFMSDPEFRTKLNDKLPEAFKIENPALQPNSSDYEVVFAIISNSGEEALSLPLFSKINLRNAAQMLRSFGMKVTTKIIPQEVGDTNAPDDEE